MIKIRLSGKWCPVAGQAESAGKELVVTARKKELVLITTAPTTQL